MNILAALLLNKVDGLLQFFYLFCEGVGVHLHLLLLLVDCVHAGLHLALHIPNQLLVLINLTLKDFNLLPSFLKVSESVSLLMKIVNTSCLEQIYKTNYKPFFPLSFSAAFFCLCSSGPSGIPSGAPSPGA